MSTQLVVDLGETFTDEGSLAGVIVERASTLVYQNLEREARVALAGRVRAIADEEIRMLLQPVLRDALHTLVQPTDTFGQPRGPRKTLAEVIVETAGKELKVRSDRYNSSSGTVLEKILHEEVGRTIRAELQDAIKQAREQTIAAIKEQGATVIAETVARMARV